MKTHDLKIEKKYFNDVIAERKKFEVRKNDRDYQVNDILSLNEYDKDKQVYTGRHISVKVLYILDDSAFLKEGYVVLSIAIIK
ncbi:hypothetical protein BCB68_07215 [Leptotrichia sp. oral taxon 498]|uniref:DUF3850 domain-containing protein n=1 Tax=Leptotrichia sp. oral taxon 498 TaxID=712368 RepID=UPI000B8CF345|nr:DUF3850 domain-containing protein [Leptotrichia sp. oral taxon 498]ASQ48732.1 hypothetical protein BCB68_07215 [Leptotrichia sp. oral taxon 498]